MTFETSVGDVETSDEMKVVAEVDSLGLLVDGGDFDPRSPVEVPVAGHATLCATPQAEGSYVFGSGLTFEATGDVDLGPVLAIGCKAVSGIGVGAASVTVRAPGVRRTVTVEVVPAE